MRWRVVRSLALIIIGLAGMVAGAILSFVPLMGRDVNITRISFKSRDGLNLVGYYVVPTESYARRPLAVVCHGFASSAEFMLGIGVLLAERGFPSLVISFRGHGLSEGKCRLGMLEYLDVMGAIDWVEQNDPEVNTSATFLIGSSMGAAISMVAGALDPRIVAVAEFSGFARLSDLTNTSELAKYYGGLEEFLGEVISEVIAFSPMDYLTENVTMHLLIAHGDADTAVPVEHAYMLYYNTSMDPALKTLKIWHGVGHDLIGYTDPLNYTFQWFSSVLGVYIAPINEDTRAIVFRLNYSYNALAMVVPLIFGTVLLFADTLHFRKRYNKKELLAGIIGIIGGCVLTIWLPQIGFTIILTPAFHGSYMGILLVAIFAILTRGKELICDGKNFLKKRAVIAFLMINILPVILLNILFYFTYCRLLVPHSLFLSIFLLLIALVFPFEYFLRNRYAERKLISFVIEIVVYATVYGVSIMLFIVPLNPPSGYYAMPFYVGFALAFLGFIFDKVFNSRFFTALTIAFLPGVLIAAYFPAI